MSQPKSTVATFLSDQIDLSPKTQREIAEMVGFENPNIISMLKEGHMKVPLNRIGALATVLGIDPSHFMRMVLEEYMPETWEAVERALGRMILSAEEEHLIRVFREMQVDDGVPAATLPLETNSIADVGNTCSQGSAPLEDIAVTVLLEHPTQGWQLLTHARALALHQGECRAAELAGQTVRVITAHVAMIERKPVALKRIGLEEWCFDDSGRVDQNFVMAKIVKKLNAAVSAHVRQTGLTSELTDADMATLQRILELPTTPQ